MENRKFVKISLIIALLNIINLTAPSRVFGYEVQTHAGITKEAIEFYNQHFSDKKISAEEARLMIDGSVSEDDAPRWFNHYYDPIYNRGLTDLRLGTLGKETNLTSKKWAHSRADQITELYNPIMVTTAGKLAMFTDPGLIEASDYTWERALRDYILGDTARAFRGLGQVVHLVEDASVPDHTRNDMHIAIEGFGGLFGEGSPYELWTGQFSESNTDLSPLLYLKKPLIFKTLDEYFDSMALYSNKNFYSKDTIDSLEYAEPKVDYKLTIGKYIFGFKRSNDGDYKLVRYKDSEESSAVLSLKEPILEDDYDFIARDYWERLAPKAVQHVAGVIDLFFREAERLKNDPDFKVEKKQSFLGQMIDIIQGFFEKNIPDGFESLAEVEVGRVAISHENTNAQKQESTEAIKQESNKARERESTKSTKIQKHESERLKKIASDALAMTKERGLDPGLLATEEGVVAEIASSLPSRNDGLVATSAATGSSGSLVSNAPASAMVCAYDGLSVSGSGINNSIIINEVAWAGTTASPSDEWIELRNISGTAVDLSGWKLIDKDDQIHIDFSSKVVASGQFVLLERTNDTTVPGISADILYVGPLGNDDDGLRLFDANCVLRDEAIAGPEWSAGSANPRRTMERQNDLSWRTYSGNGVDGIFGTPKTANTEGGTSASSGPAIASGVDGVSAVLLPPSPLLLPASLATHIVISEVSAGIDGNTEYEFVELYNPTDTVVDMTGWSLKKKSSSGAETNLVSASAFAGTIAPKSFFLIAHPSYAGTKIADLKYSAASQNLAYSNNSAIIYDAVGVRVDEASWIGIEKGRSLERKTIFGSGCVSPQGDGEFQGNSCDTDALIDFESRAIPDPQNKNSLPEPRGKPLAASDFDARFYPATMETIFSWGTTTDATGSTSVAYIIEEKNTGGTTTPVTETASVGYRKKFNEIGRDYSFAIYARDRDGLASDIVSVSTTTPSFVKSISFYNNPINAGEKLLDIFFEKYPFVSDPLNTGATWKILTFNLNAPAQKEPMVDTPMNWEPAEKSELLPIRYNLRSDSTGARYSLILPDDASRDFGGGVASSAHNHGRLMEDGIIRLRVQNSSQLSSADYLRVSYYDFAGGGAGNQTFYHITSDATKFYFKAEAENKLPTSPQQPKIQSLATSTNKLFVSWGQSTDVDGADAGIRYEFNFVTATATIESAIFNEAGWRTPWLGAASDAPLRIQTMQDVLPGNYYIFGLRAIDELGATSTVSTTESYRVPVGGL